MKMYLTIALVALPSFLLAYPHPFGDPFSPLGSWNHRSPPCGLPPFTSKLPEESQEKAKAIWEKYEEGTDCTELHRKTKEVIYSLGETARESIFAARCGPSFLREVSPAVRREFRSVWFDHKMSLEAKELALKKLAYSMLSGESLALFNKWDDELQERKTDLAEKIAVLSTAAKNALEEWRAIRQEERDFLARLPKDVKEELRSLYVYWPRLNTTTTTTSTSTTTTTTEASSMTTEEPSTTTEESESEETTTLAEEAEKEFAHLLDFVLPDELSRDVTCNLYF